MNATEAGCRKAERALQAYVDRSLSAADIREIESHLEVCEHCAQCYRFESEVRAVVRRALDEPCPERLKVRLRNLCAECDCE